MKFYNKVLSCLAVGAMVMSMTACGGNSSQTASTDAAGASADTATSDAAATDTKASDTEKSSDQDVTLTMWTIATESDAFHEPFTKAIADYEAAHPGVKIKMETFENEAYKTKIKAAVAGNELPDIFYTWGGGFSQAFVESGKVLQLDDYYKDYSDGISKAALGNATYDDKLYGVAYVTPISCMFYNKKIFDQYKITVPDNFEDFKKVCQTLKDNGVTPLGNCVKDTWVLAMIHDGLTLKSAGPDQTAKAVTGNGVSYNSPDFIKSATSLQELVDMGAFLDGATGLSNDEACQEFYKGNVAMYITGSWMSGSIATDASTPDDFDVAPIPVVNSSNAKITDFMGGAADTLMVSAATKQPDLAAEAAFEISKGVSKYAYLSGAGIPAWTVDYEVSDVSPMTAKIVDYAKNATSFTLWFDTLMSSDNAGEYLSLLQQLFIKDLTPEDFCKAMDEQINNK